MSHFPFASWDGMSNGAIMLHGHLHGSKCELNGYDSKRIMDVGIDNNNLFPFSLDGVISKMKNIPLPKYNHHGSEV